MAAPGPLKLIEVRILQTARSIGISLGNYLLIIVLVMSGVAFLVASGIMALSQAVGAINATLYVGVALVILGGLWGAAMIWRARRRRRRRQTAAVNAAMTASTVSLANTGLRLFSRGGAKVLFPLAATAVAIWMFTGQHSDDADD